MNGVINNRFHLEALLKNQMQEIPKLTEVIWLVDYTLNNREYKNIEVKTCYRTLKGKKDDAYEMIKLLIPKGAKITFAIEKS
jgi:hypothetical protein